MADRQPTSNGSQSEYLISAVLRVAGVTFDPAGILAKHSLHGDRVWLKGSVDRRGRVQATSGFNLSIVKANSEAALRDAVYSFVTSQSSFVSDVRQADGTCELDFGMMVGPARMISFHLAPDLLSLLAAEGITVHVSAYPCADDE